MWTVLNKKYLDAVVWTLRGGAPVKVTCDSRKAGRRVIYCNLFAICFAQFLSPCRIYLSVSAHCCYYFYQHFLFLRAPRSNFRGLTVQNTLRTGIIQLGQYYVSQVMSRRFTSYLLCSKV